VTRLIKLGVIELSGALANTKFFYIEKKTKDDAANPEQQAETYHRKINGFTEHDSYPMPPLEDINFLALHQFYSTLDLRNGYWAVPMAEAFRKFTSVKRALSVIQYARMPMGFKNASEFFQRMIENMLRQFLWNFCLTYLDDVNMWTATAQEHVTAVNDLLQDLLAKGLKLKISKCKIGNTSIETLGLRIS
jgi:Reverse transcriptase (RNA-dependent DNA polymerase)